MNTPIGNDRVLKIGVGMAKIGTFHKYDPKHIENRLGIVEKLAGMGKVFVDTSPIYGSGFSEKILGDILNKNREKYYVATKYFPENSHSDVDLIKSVNESLNRMKIDQIDLLQIHWPNPHANLNLILKGFSALYKSGVIKNLGLCNFEDIEIHELLEDNPNIKVISNQIELHLGNIGRSSSNKTFLAPKTIAYGSILQGRYAYSEKQRFHLVKLAENYSVSPAALALSILFYNIENLLPVLKISTENHLNEILQIFEFSDGLFGTNHDLLKLKTEICYVDASKITLTGDAFRKPYLTHEEALRNDLQLFPSPTTLAERILKNNLVLPVKVVLKSEDKFLIDPYDPFDQVKKYWAWRIAYPSEKIPIDLIE